MILNARDREATVYAILNDKIVVGREEENGDITIAWEFDDGEFVTKAAVEAMLEHAHANVSIGCEPQQPEQIGTEPVKPREIVYIGHGHNLWAAALAAHVQDAEPAASAWTREPPPPPVEKIAFGEHAPRNRKERRQLKREQRSRTW